VTAEPLPRGLANANQRLRRAGMWFALILTVCLTVMTSEPRIASATQPFLPAYDVTISDPTAGAHSDVRQRTTIPAHHHVIASSVTTIPPGRDIASDQAMPDGAVIGSGSLAIDRDCDGTIENYTLTIFETGTSEPDEKTNWQGTGLPFMQINFVVRGDATSGHTIEALLFTGILMPPLCSPMEYVLNLLGISADNPGTNRDESGNPVLTNPPATTETWNTDYQSAPLSFPPQHQIVVCDSVAIGGVSPTTDSDADGISDDCDPDDDNDGFTDAAEGAIGTGALDPCGHNGWPAELAGNDNRLTIGDFSSFLFPLRADGSFNKIGHPVPDPADANIERWNLQVDGTINVGDLNALNPAVDAPTSRPPMFGGQPAFFANVGNGVGGCPFPP